MARKEMFNRSVYEMLLSSFVNLIRKILINYEVRRNKAIIITRKRV